MLVEPIGAVGRRPANSPHRRSQPTSPGEVHRERSALLCSAVAFCRPLRLSGCYLFAAVITAVSPSLVQAQQSASIIDNGYKYVDQRTGQNCVTCNGTYSLSGWMFDKIEVEIKVLDANGNEQAVPGYPNKIVASVNGNAWAINTFTGLAGGPPTKTYKVYSRLWGILPGSPSAVRATNIATYQF